MKCPKCHYLSFDPEPRCRNCGFSLGLEATDLPIAAVPADASPLVDFELRTAADDAAAPAFDVATSGDPAAASAHSRTELAPDPPPRPVRRIASTPRPRPRPVDGGPKPAEVTPFGQAAPVSPHPTTELPLFVKGLADRTDTPASAAVDAVEPAARVERVADETERPAEPVPVVAPPPHPVSEEPAASAAPMWSGARRKLGPLDRDLLNDLERIEKQEQQAKEAAADTRPQDRAGVGRRLAAAVTDGVILGGMLLALVAVTLRWTLLGWDDLAMLSVWPSMVFLTMMAYGYLSLFTAATGQTPGKMLVGIRVVGVDADGSSPAPLSPARACLRELIALPSMLLLGLGFWPALVGNERGLHDRLAATRVVRA